jgi:hypothetical protein
MADAEHENERCGVFNPGDDPVVADPITPKFAEAVALQRLTDRAGVIKRSDPVAKEAKNPRGGLRTEFVELARGGPFELNPPRRSAG